MTENIQNTPEVVQDIKVEEPNKLKGNYFTELASIDVSNYVEKKNGYSYLSWAFAVDQLKRKQPDAQIIVKRFPDPDLNGLPVPYLKTSLGYFVEVEVIVQGVSYSEPFPILDYRNKPIAKPTPFDINASIQRAKVKAIAAHGLGLYIYAGEDLPIDSEDASKQQTQQSVPQYQQQQQRQQYQRPPVQQQNSNLISLQQQQQIRDLTTQIATLTLGTGATQEAIVAQLKNIYAQYRISANLPSDVANTKIIELQNAIKAIHDQRMAQQQTQQQVQQQTAASNLFDVPAM